jgi:hypothetical protein
MRSHDPHLQGRCGQGYLWTALVPGQCMIYEWHTSRAVRCLDSLLGPGFAGKRQCDGYSAYPAFAKEKAMWPSLAAGRTRDATSLKRRNKHHG